VRRAADRLSICGCGMLPSSLFSVPLLTFGRYLCVFFCSLVPPALGGAGPSGVSYFFISFGCSAGLPYITVVLLWFALCLRGVVMRGYVGEAVKVLEGGGGVLCWWGMTWVM
jgi:hypothetical protein